MSPFSPMTGSAALQLATWGVQGPNPTVQRNLHQAGAWEMVSQSAARQDSPVDLWEAVNDDPADIDGSPSLLDTDRPPCQLDVRFTRHRAAWINPQCVQQELQDLTPQVPAEGDSERHDAGDAASPLSPSGLCLRGSVAETSLSKDIADSTGISPAPGSAEKSSAFSPTSTEERAVLPGHCSLTSLFTNSKIAATSPGREANSAFLNPSQPTASADAGNFLSVLMLALPWSEAKCSLYRKSSRVTTLPTSQGTSSVHIVFSPATWLAPVAGIKDFPSPWTAGESHLSSTWLIGSVTSRLGVGMCPQEFPAH